MINRGPEEWHGVPPDEIRAAIKRGQEQSAPRLGWGCLRENCSGHVWLPLATVEPEEHWRQVEIAALCDACSTPYVFKLWMKGPEGGLADGPVYIDQTRGIYLDNEAVVSPE